jgi:hypothetical protein
MGRRQGARRARILKRYVTDEQRSRRPIFIATLRAAASWLFLRVGRSLRIKSRYARRSRLEKQPPDRGRNKQGCRGQDPTATGTTVIPACLARMTESVPFEFRVESVRQIQVLPKYPPI